MKKYKLCVHVGLEKTGTTAVQQILRDYDFRTKTKFYFDGNSNQNLVVGFLKNNNIDNLWADRFSSIHSSGSYSKFLNFLKHNNKSNVILSSEHLSARLLDLGIEKFLADVSVYHNVEVILVRRKYDHWIRSKYNEAVKNGCALSFCEFNSVGDTARWGRIDQTRIIEDWKKHTFNNHKYIEINYSDNVVNDVLRYLDLPDINCDEIKNKSNSAWKYKILRFLNRFRFFDQKLVRRFLIKVFFQ